MLKNLRGPGIERMRRDIESLPADFLADFLADLKTAFIESLAESELKFYGPRMTSDRLPTRFIAWAADRLKPATPPPCIA